MELSILMFTWLEPFEYKFKSNAIALTVKPLPEKINQIHSMVKPANFL